MTPQHEIVIHDTHTGALNTILEKYDIGVETLGKIVEVPVHRLRDIRDGKSDAQTEGEFMSLYLALNPHFMLNAVDLYFRRLTPEEAGTIRYFARKEIEMEKAPLRGSARFREEKKEKARRA